MTNLELLAKAWDWEPSIVAGCVALALLYVWAVRFRITKSSLFFLGGVLLLLFSLVSPLDVLGGDYLFSVHVVQHLVLALMIPPLLLAGIDLQLAKRILSLPGAAAAEHILRQPALAWIIGVGSMAFWHIPAPFNAALANAPLHAMEHLWFLVSGTIFWWPVMSPLARSRLMAVPWAFLYLFAACLAYILIGSTLTFSSPGIYPAYLHPHDEFGILPLVRGQWGLSAQADHQTGGLLMWVLGCSVYLCASMGMFARWYRDGRTAALETIAAMPVPPKPY